MRACLERIFTTSREASSNQIWIAQPLFNSRILSRDAARQRHHSYLRKAEPAPFSLVEFLSSRSGSCLGIFFGLCFPSLLSSSLFFHQHFTPGLASTQRPTVADHTHLTAPSLYSFSLKSQLESAPDGLGNLPLMV